MKRDVDKRNVYKLYTDAVIRFGQPENNDDENFVLKVIPRSVVEIKLKLSSQI